MSDENAMLVRPGETQTSLERLFESVFGDSAAFRLRHPRSEAGFDWAPPVDIRETDNELVVYASLPGLNKEDVTLEVRDNVLTLSGKMKAFGSQEESWIRREMPRGEFYRAFHLPADVQVGKVKASMRSGVLEIRLPKAEEARPHKIAID
jgi:HSP20 family protein